MNPVYYLILGAICTTAGIFFSVTGTIGIFKRNSAGRAETNQIIEEGTGSLTPLAKLVFVKADYGYGGGPTLALTAINFNKFTFEKFYIEYLDNFNLPDTLVRKNILDGEYSNGEAKTEVRSIAKREYTEVLRKGISGSSMWDKWECLFTVYCDSLKYEMTVNLNYTSDHPKVFYRFEGRKYTEKEFEEFIRGIKQIYGPPVGYPGTINE